MLAAMSVVLMLLMSPLRAQETTVEQTTTQTEETTMAVKEAEESTSEGAAQATNKAAQAEDGESEDDSSVEAQAQATDQELRFPSGTQTVSAQRARQFGGPLVGTSVETLSTDDGDQFVEVILIRRPDCEVERGASFVLEDEDGTQATFIEAENTQSPSTESNVRIRERREGLRVTSDSADDNNIVPINEVGSDEDLDTGGLRIVTSTGITCAGGEDGDDGEDEGDDGGGGTSGGTDGSDDCDTLAVLEGEDREAENFRFPGNEGRLRIVYSTLNAEGSIEINVGDMSKASVVSETITDARSGVIRTDVTAPGRLFVSVDPSDQTYKVTFEAVGGDDECTRPGEQGDVLTDANDDDDDIINVPDDDLPDTGGLPISVLAGCVALLLVGTAVMGTALRRRQ